MWGSEWLAGFLYECLYIILNHKLLLTSKKNANIKVKKKAIKQQHMVKYVIFKSSYIKEKETKNIASEA